MNTPPVYDATPEQLAMIAADRPPKKRAERLACALQRAKFIAHAHSAQPDEPPACFFSAVLDTTKLHIGREEARQIITAAGLICHDVKPRLFTHLLITGFAQGQGTRRTAMVKAFADQLNRDGIPAYILAQV